MDHNRVFGTEPPFSTYKPLGWGASTCRRSCSPLPIVIEYHRATSGSGPWLKRTLARLPLDICDNPTQRREDTFILDRELELQVRARIVRVADPLHGVMLAAALRNDPPHQPASRRGPWWPNRIDEGGARTNGVRC